MEQHKFNQAKEELLADMIDANMCAESISKVAQCSNLKALVDTMNHYFVTLIGEDFPKVEWLRKHFDRYELYELGIYLDFIAVDIAPKDFIYLFGNSIVTIYGNETSLKRVMCRQNSRLLLHSLEFSMWSVELQHQSRLDIMQQDKYSKISIRDKRK